MTSNGKVLLEPVTTRVVGVGVAEIEAVGVGDGGVVGGTTVLVVGAGGTEAVTDTGGTNVVFVVVVVSFTSVVEVGEDGTLVDGLVVVVGAVVVDVMVVTTGAVVDVVLVTTVEVLLDGRVVVVVDGTVVDVVVLAGTVEVVVDVGTVEVLVLVATVVDVDEVVEDGGATHPGPCERLNCPFHTPEISAVAEITCKLR